LGAPASGGGFVARADDGRVVFVRHGLPGERVLATLTESHARWARADAIEILAPSTERVTPPCAAAGPGRCGGCDYQHASLAAQRRFKALALEEQLRRVAKLERAVEVEAYGDTGLGTRTRLRFGVAEDGTLGMRQRASTELYAVEGCPLGVEEIGQADLAAERYPAGHDVEVVALVPGEPALVALVEWTDEDPDPTDASFEAEDAGTEESSSGLRTVSVTLAQDSYRVSPGSFFQIHRQAPHVLVDAVLDGLRAREGEHVLDLYAGVGLFSAPLARAVGTSGVVVAVESAPTAAADARANLAAFTQAQVVDDPVRSSTLGEIAAGAVAAVLDPPRAGVDKGVLEALIEEPTMERIVLVSCNPATFARDLKILLDAGFELMTLRALDLFEMTEHLEIVASLRR
jgi:tRNA/tmRNA/rRNA uracil-C5-methylase (TrmA/RlmC/RlmD family)